MAQFATSDAKLNSHIFGNIPLKLIDFQSPELYKMFKVKKPKDKQEVYKHQMDKLNILISMYNRNDFQNLQLFQLNAD